MQLLTFLTPIYNTIYPYYLRECPIKILEFVTMCHSSQIFIRAFSLDQFIVNHGDVFPLLDPFIFNNLIRHINTLQEIEKFESVSNVRPVFERAIRAHMTGPLIGQLESAIANPSIDSSDHLDRFIESDLPNFEYNLNFCNTNNLMELLINFEIEDPLMWMVVMVKFKMSVQNTPTFSLKKIHLQLQGPRFEKWELRQNTTFNIMFGAIINYLRAICILSQNKMVCSLILQELLLNFGLYNFEIQGV